MMSSKIPKALNSCLESNEYKIDLFYMQPDEINSGWCIWVHLAPEWYSPEMECRTIRENSAREAIKKINQAVQVDPK